jgi:hypothetical protein
MITNSILLTIYKHYYTHGLRPWWTATAVKQLEMIAGGLQAT